MNSLILQTISRFLVGLMLLFSIFLLLRGHNEPGGGFIGGLVAAAGIVYLIGSYTRFLAPDYLAAVSPIYIVAIISEVALCLWLLVKGVNLQRWEETTAAVPPAA